MSNTKPVVVIVVMAVLAVVGLFIWEGRSPEASGKYDSFAQCLAQKDVTMYGAAWCTFCKKERAAFGDSFKYIKYIECPDSPQLCAEKGINGYPTWIFPDGKKLEGYQGVEKLSQESGCELPK
jgi:hypothetical protein